MNRSHFHTLIMGAVILLIASSAYSADLYYVQPSSAKIYSAPSFAAKVLAVAPSGYQFTASGKQGNWLRFTFNGKTAFLPFVQVSAAPPLARAVTRGSDAPQKLSGRSRTSSAAAVAGVKGLTYEDRARVSKGERIDYDALDRMEAVKVSPEELKTFMEGGKP